MVQPIFLLIEEETNLGLLNLSEVEDTVIAIESLLKIQKQLVSSKGISSKESMILEIPIKTICNKITKNDDKVFSLEDHNLSNINVAMNIASDNINRSIIDGTSKLNQWLENAFVWIEESNKQHDIEISKVFSDIQILKSKNKNNKEYIDDLLADCENNLLYLGDNKERVINSVISNTSLLGINLSLKFIKVILDNFKSILTSDENTIFNNVHNLFTKVLNEPLCFLNKEQVSSLEDKYSYDLFLNKLLTVNCIKNNNLYSGLQLQISNKPAIENNTKLQRLDSLEINKILTLIENEILYGYKYLNDEFTQDILKLKSLLLINNQEINELAFIKLKIAKDIISTLIYFYNINYKYNLIFNKTLIEYCSQSLNKGN